MDKEYLSELTGYNITDVELKGEYYYLTYESVMLAKYDAYESALKLLEEGISASMKETLKIYFPDCKFILVPSKINYSIGESKDYKIKKSDITKVIIDSIKKSPF